MNTCFRFINFSPRQGLVTYANRVLEDIVDRSPSDSACFAEAKKVKGGYVFHVRVNSPVAHFVGNVFLEDSGSGGPRLWQLSALDTLKTQVFHQLDSWIKSRSDEFEKYVMTWRVAA